MSNTQFLSWIATPELNMSTIFHNTDAKQATDPYKPEL